MTRVIGTHTVVGCARIAHDDGMGGFADGGVEECGTIAAFLRCQRNKLVLKCSGLDATDCRSSPRLVYAVAAPPAVRHIPEVAFADRIVAKASNLDVTRNDP